MVDLNGDGNRDMISGSFTPGDLYIFAGSGDGSFKAAETLQDKDGKNLNVGWGSTAFAADWDQDGDLDLCLGNMKGQVFWAANEGDAKTAIFGIPVPMMAGGKPLVVHVDAGPCMVDWDGDGHLDLLVSDELGAVTFFRNLATAGLPQLAAGVTLVTRGKKYNSADGRGGRSKICVADWNEDGRLDLLLGDFSSGSRGPEPQLTEAQVAERDAALAAYAEINKKLEVIYAQSRKDFLREHGIAEGQKLSDQQNREAGERSFGLWHSNADFQELKKKSLAQSKIFTQYQAHTPYHGYVWVFLRKAEGRGVIDAGLQHTED